MHSRERERERERKREREKERERHRLGRKIKSRTESTSVYSLKKV